MRFLKCNFPVLIIAATVSVGCVAVLAQSTYNVGRTPTSEEIKAWDVAVGVDGKGLPPGSGTAKQGAPIYARKCAPCHGATGTEAIGSVPPRRFVGGQGTLKNLNPVKTIGSFWPFAVPIWDQIYRAMPPGQEGSLKPDEAYALTALLLYWNGIIKENDAMDAKSLPKVQMPNRNGFVPDWPPQYKIGAKRLYGQYP
jgi:hypothetical protein